jgi:hypothetical protein
MVAFVSELLDTLLRTASNGVDVGQDPPDGIEVLKRNLRRANLDAGGVLDENDQVHHRERVEEPAREQRGLVTELGWMDSLLLLKILNESLSSQHSGVHEVQSEFLM